MPPWLKAQPFSCVDCGTSIMRRTSTSVRCPDCLYLEVLRRNRVRRRLGPFFFNCARCGTPEESAHGGQKYCAPCMYAAELEKDLERARARRVPRIAQCHDCGVMIVNARPVQKRCPGCQFLRAKGGDTKPYRGLNKSYKPRDCVGCGEPWFYHPMGGRKYPDLCLTCSGAIRQQEQYAAYKERMLDPAYAGRVRGQLSRRHQERREAAHVLLRERPDIIERAALSLLAELGEQT